MMMFLSKNCSFMAFSSSDFLPKDPVRIFYSTWKFLNFIFDSTRIILPKELMLSNKTDHDHHNRLNPN